MKRLTFLKINEFEEYEPDVFCTVQYNEVKAQTHVIQTRCNTLARHVKKIHKMLDVCSETETNQQWDGYRIAIGNYLAEALILSVGRYVVTTASYFIIFRLLKVNASTRTILVTICSEGYFKVHFLFGDYFGDYFQFGNYFLKE